MRRAGTLLLFSVVGAIIWFFYLFWSGSFAPLGNCGGHDLLGYYGHLVGGSASTGWAAAVVGAALAVASAAAASRRKRMAPILVAFVGVYVAGLFVLALAVAPLIWGARHCVLY